MLNLNHFQTKQEAEAAAGEALNLLLMDNAKYPILLMLSGGSALAMLDYISLSSLSENITISVLDERFTEDPQINNFSMLQKTDFYKEAFDAGCSFFGTLPRPKETAEDLAKRWGKNLREWIAENHPPAGSDGAVGAGGGKIFATIGMGADGHTAGIFPFADDGKQFDRLFSGDAWITAYAAIGKNPYPERITATISFLKQIDAAIGFVCGEQKKEKLVAVLKKQGKVNELPALLWHKIRKIQLATDIY